MPRSSRDTMNKLLRTVYRDRLREQMPVRAVLLQEILRQEPENFTEGDMISVPLHVAHGAGFAFSGVGKLPAAAPSIVERALYNYRWMTDRGEVAGDFQQDTSAGGKAEARILDLETRGMARGMRRGLCFHLYGDGSGKLANVVSSTAANTLTVDDTRGIADNMRVDVLLSASGDTGGGVVGAQVRVNRKTKTLTLRFLSLADYAAVNSAPTTYAVYRQGSRNQAWWGLEAWASLSNPPTGTYLGGIDRTIAGNEFWQAQVFDNGGVPREPDFPTMQDMLDVIDDHAESEVRLIVCGPRVWNWLAAKLDAKRQYGGERMTLHGWMQAIKFGTIDAPVVKDPMCPPTKMFFFDPSILKIWQVNEGDWMQEDGAILHRVPDYVAYEFSWYRRGELVCEKPQALGVIEDLTTELPLAA